MILYDIGSSYIGPISFAGWFSVAYGTNNAAKPVTGKDWGTYLHVQFHPVTLICQVATGRI